MREQRYSIHPSPKSPEFTTIKQTINVEGSRRITTVALTDAVKKQSGFSIILVRRCQNLVDAPRISFRHKPQDKLLGLAEFDPTQFTLFVGIFVGHPDTKFDVTNEEIVIAPFYFGNFQIVLMASLLTMPSHHTTEFVHALTTPPELAKHEHQGKLLRHLMTGKSPLICIQQYQNSVKWLAKRFLERMLLEVTNPEVAEAIRKRISAMGNVTLKPQDLGLAGQSIHLLTDGNNLANSQ